MDTPAVAAAHEWSSSSETYACADGVLITYRQRKPDRLFKEDDDILMLCLHDQDTLMLCIHPASRVRYEKENFFLGRVPTCLVSGAEFDRGMSTLLREADSVRTIVLPRSVRRLGESAFRGVRSLRAFVPSARLEDVGEYAFYRSGLDTADANRGLGGTE